MRNVRGTLWLLALASLVVLAAPQAMALCCVPDQGEGELADVAIGTSGIDWRVFAEHTAVHLTVSTPCGVIERTYQAGKDPSFSLEELAPDNPDGRYAWQIRIEPVVSAEVQEALRESRQTGDEEIAKELCRKGMLPTGPFIQTGEFSVLKGSIIDPFQQEDRGKLQVKQPANAATANLGVLDAEGVNKVTAKTVISGDLTVYNSLCVGFDCLTSETYGADTIRLKENNLRIHADDTSTAASFPRTDWRLEFNSQANGGGSYFRVVDASANRNIMTLEANAPSHSLYVDDGGRVGFGTSTPSVELHVVDGDTPTLRLAQDGSSGFAPQTWDIAGNETSFFIRDATNGSTLPFRIRPGAASNAIVIDTDDQVGIGKLTSDADLNVLQRSSVGFHLERAGNPVTMLFEDTTAAKKWEFKINAGGDFAINDPGSPNGEAILNSAGDLTLEGEIFTSGSCSGGCDRVFLADYPLESIEDHAASMWENRFLPGVGPTPEGSVINLSQKTTGILNELEKAHIYIEQLHDRMQVKDERIANLEQRLSAVERSLAPASQDDDASHN